MTFSMDVCRRIRELHEHEHKQLGKELYESVAAEFTQSTGAVVSRKFVEERCWRRFKSRLGY